MLAPNHRSLALGALTAGLVLGASGLLASRHPALSLLLPLAALLLLAVVLRPEWGFYAIVFMVPLESFRGLSESFESLTISKLLGMAVAGAFLLRWVHDKRLPPQLRSNLWPWILTWLAAKCDLVFVMTERTEIIRHGIKKMRGSSSEST